MRINFLVLQFHDTVLLCIVLFNKSVRYILVIAFISVLSIVFNIFIVPLYNVTHH